MKTRILRLNSIWLALLMGVAAGSAAETSIQSPHSVSTNAIAPPLTDTPAAGLSLKPVQQPATPTLSVWAAQVAKLAQGGIDEAVVLSFVDSAGTFNLTADQIITLSQLGVSRDVISAMIQHDAEIISGARQVFASTVPDFELPVLAVNRGLPSVQAPGSTREQTPAPGAIEDAQSQEIPVTEELSLAYYWYQPFEEPAVVHERSPVRKPYPVKLTDPIIVFRGQGKPPNTMLLEGFP